MAKRTLGITAAIVLLALAGASTSNQGAIAGLVWDVTTGAVLVETTIDVGSIAQPTPDSTVQWGIVHFDDPTKIVDRLLVGDYVLVHDHYWDSGDRPCTTIYEFESNRAVEAVASFSCRRIAHPTKLDRFSVLVRPADSPEQCARWELIGFWFAGISEIHRVLDYEIPTKSGGTDLAGS
jgi:hypothetical protein